MLGPGVQEMGQIPRQASWRDAFSQGTRLDLLGHVEPAPCFGSARRA